MYSEDKGGMKVMLIKEVAKRLNTTTRTIRFYEEKGLIQPTKRENDYRTFTDEEVMRLSTILALRELGLEIKAIKQLIDGDAYSMYDYLNIQRERMFERWLEMKDMILTIDRILEQHTDDGISVEDVVALSKHLKNLKTMRKSWSDRWNFDKQAAEYDKSLKLTGYRFNVHQDYEVALEKVISTIQLKAGDTCLDIGIGTGNLSSRLLPKGIKVIGVDQSEKMLEECKRKHPEIDIRKGHFLALPILDQQVNAIVSSYALHHINDEQKLLALEEMDRVLYSNGEICIADLMFHNETHRQEVICRYRKAGNIEAVEAIEDEFYADRSLLVNWFHSHHYEVTTYSFHPFLSMIYAKKGNDIL